MRQVSFTSLMKGCCMHTSKEISLVTSESHNTHTVPVCVVDHLQTLV